MNVKFTYISARSCSYGEKLKLMFNSTTYLKKYRVQVNTHIYRSENHPFGLLKLATPSNRV